MVSSIGLLASSTGWCLSSQVEALVNFETHSNAAATRSNDPVKIQNYEIPLKLLKANIADRMPQDVKNSLIFQKDGETYVRWLINPEDTKWHLDVEKFLKSKGVSAEKHSYFTGYMTASRSYIIEDPNTKAVFSGKVSTNITGGNWRDKKQAVDDAEEARMASDFVQAEKARAPFQDLVIMDEPAMFGIEGDVDQAMLIRTLADLPKGDKIYIPGFAVMHDETGKKIAALNGSKDPEAYWEEHYNQPLAKAVAEFAARTGLTYDSPHSQNFLVELDSKMKPTGKIVFRDFGDTYAFAPFFQKSNEGDFLKKWESDNVLKQLDVGIGIIHGNTPPSWLSDDQYNAWGTDFYKQFEAEYSRISGVPLSDLQATLSRNGDYFGKDYTAKADKGWNDYFATLAANHQARVVEADAKSAKPAFAAGADCATAFGE
jgi:hypothetical protein